MTTAGSLPVPNNWIKDRFGSKKGLLNYSLFEAKRIAGLYSSLKVEKHLRPERLVFVCVGNICRSPLAEAVAKSRGYNAISYGLDTRGNDNADPRAVLFASQNNLDLTKHKTRRIDDYIAMKGDLVVGMEPKHMRIFRGLNTNSQFTLLGLYGKRENTYIHDPYNTNSKFFNRCENIVLNATYSLINYVK